MLKKIQNEAPHHKISIHRFLSTNLALLQDCIPHTPSLTISHVKHEANKVAEHLENEGVSRNQEELIAIWENIYDSPLRHAYLQLAHSDISSLHGVSHSNNWLMVGG
jgi:hypothetical protein